jgi:hypothetical protein
MDDSTLHEGMTAACPGADTSGDPLAADVNSDASGTKLDRNERRILASPLERYAEKPVFDVARRQRTYGKWWRERSSRIRKLYMVGPYLPCNLSMTDGNAV